MSKQHSKYANITHANTQKEDDNIDEDLRQYLYSEAIAQKQEVTNDFVTSKKAPPSVMNPFDFPSLKTKGPMATQEDNIAAFEAPVYTNGFNTFFGEEDHIEDDENVELATAKKQHSEFSEQILAALEERFNQFAMTDPETPKLINTDTELDNPIFRFNYPDIITDPNFVFKNPMVKTLTSKLTFTVYLTNIFSPSQFYFQYGDESLFVLMNYLYDFYSQLPPGDLVVSVESIKPGLTVVAKMSESWLRAQVVDVPDSNGDTKLFFVDFGVVNSTNVSNLRYLLQRFTCTPKKALRGSMVGVAPQKAQDNWSILSRQAFVELVDNKKLCATIRFYREEDDVYELELSSRVNSPILIAEMFASGGFAEIKNIEENSPYAIPLPIADQKIFAA